MTSTTRVRFGALLTVALWLGPGRAAQAAEELLEFEIDGQQRRVLLFVPDRPAAEPRTLVVVFHGRGDDDREFARAVRLHHDWPDAIVAYPRGETRDASNKRGWQYRVGDQSGRDLALTDRLLEEATRRYGTQPERTHVAGFSNGGHFVLLLLAERPQAFATFTVIGSVMPDFQSESPPRPVLYLFGTGEDRRYKEDWAATVQALARHNRTDGPLAKFLGCCHLQSPAAGGAPFVFGTYGAGHIWPSQGNEWLMEFTRHPWPKAPAEPAR